MINLYNKEWLHDYFTRQKRKKSFLQIIVINFKWIWLPNTFFHRFFSTIQYSLNSRHITDDHNSTNCQSIDSVFKSHNTIKTNLKKKLPPSSLPLPRVAGLIDERLVRMHSEHVGGQVALLLGAVITERTAESRRLSTLVEIVGSHVVPVLVGVAASRALVHTVLLSNVFAELTTGQTGEIALVAAQVLLVIGCGGIRLATFPAVVHVFVVFFDVED